MTDISILSVFPELYTSFLNTSLIARAQENKIVQCNLDSFFSFVKPKERIDAPIFGHGAGMLIKPEVVERAIAGKEQKFGKAYKIFFSPQGKKIDQPTLHRLAQIFLEKQHIMILAARYEGMDARVEEQYADEVLSLGDFVLMAGDLPAMVLLEGVLRLMPGVVGKPESVEQESFEGPFLDCPHYTEPVTWRGKQVPDVLRSGNHAAIDTWRNETAAQKTVVEHFDWLRAHIQNDADKKLANKFIPSHYVTLMHTDVLLPGGKVGTTSITSVDIHDIARSSKTYGLKEYFIVTPLKDQQKVAQTLLDFWQQGHGIDYNKQRHEAVKSVSIQDSLDTVIELIRKKEKKEPLLIATSARVIGNQKMITYFDQERVWKEDRPVLFLLGTGKGLSEKVLERADYVLLPLEGFSDFNHLSVRSAAAAIFDRWFGINLITTEDLL
jgi:tRNA (guanine37-N1)-methyltransferase